MVARLSKIGWLVLMRVIAPIEVPRCLRVAHRAGLALIKTGLYQSVG